MAAFDFAQFTQDVLRLYTDGIAEKIPDVHCYLLTEAQLAECVRKFGWQQVRPFHLENMTFVVDDLPEAEYLAPGLSDLVANAVRQELEKQLEIPRKLVLGNFRSFIRKVRYPCLWGSRNCMKQ